MGDFGTGRSSDSGCSNRINSMGKDGNRLRKTRRKEKYTYTKKAVMILLIIGVVNAEIPWILSMMGRDPVGELAIAWITEIVAVILGYMCKAYHETKQEEIMKFRREELEDE